MKPTYVIIGIVVVAAVVGVAALSASGPDLDTIIANKDCKAAGQLTEADIAGSTAKQQLGIGALLGTCLVMGGG